MNLKSVFKDVFPWIYFSSSVGIWAESDGKVQYFRDRRILD